MAQLYSSKAILVQTGGPTAVANETLVGAIRTFKQYGIKPIAALGGWDGLARCSFSPMDGLNDRELDFIGQTPAFHIRASKGLKVIPSTEDILTGDTVSAGRIVRNLREFGASSLCVIGGNSSAKVLGMIESAALDLDFRLRIGYGSKTIDNDLYARFGQQINDHTPGFGSAAKGVAELSYAYDHDNRACGVVFISIAMGRDAGWLAASAALARQSQEDGPHLIYLPEKEFKIDQFRQDVGDVVSKFGRAYVVVSEGVWTMVGGVKTRLVDLAADVLGLCNQVQMERKMGGANASANTPLMEMYLSNILRRQHKEVRTDALGYYVRCYPHRSDVDVMEAREIGRRVAMYSMLSPSGTVLMVREFGDLKTRFVEAPLSSVDVDKVSPVPDHFINAEGNHVTPAFIHHIKPIVGRLNFEASHPAYEPEYHQVYLNEMAV